MPQQIDPGDAGHGGVIATLLAHVLSVVFDHWVEFSTLAISAIGLFWAVKNYRANIAVKKIEAEKLRLEIEDLREENEKPE